MLSRKERVKQVRAQLEKEWHDKWWSFMMENEVKLEWGSLSRNPNITMKDIKENPDKPWNWYYISSNPFTWNKREYLIQQYRRHLASYRIQQHWQRIRSDPYHPVGKKRLELEYDRLFGYE